MEVLEDIQDELENEDFIDNLDSILSVDRDYEKKVYNYDWLEIIEETLPYLDNIFRNPKRFIVNDEEIVKVEQARKITVESVIHLTQHTNYIQDIDNVTGDVRPSKILNINKEESLDTYENRFIYTLVNNLIHFFDTRKADTGSYSYYKDKKDFNYQANSKVANEDISINLSIKSLDKDEFNSNNSEISLDDRYSKIKVQLDGFLGTELYQNLAKLHVPAVRSPIRKTNVILKNPNFQKAESLWNYIQTFTSKNEVVNDRKNYYDDSLLKKQYDLAILETYIANKSISNQSKVLTQKKVVSDMINRLINNILDSQEDMDEDKIKVLFERQLESVKKKNIHSRDVITNIFTDKLERGLKLVDDAFKILEDK